MPHLRSELNRQKRDAKRFILDMSFHDSIIAETVCIVTDDMVRDFLKQRYVGVFPEGWEIEKGEIIIDSRGRGSFQGGENVT